MMGNKSNDTTKKPFSQDLHKKYEKGEADRGAINTLMNLRAKLALKGDLFKEQETRELEQYKQLYPDVWEQVENLDAFQELTPLQQKKVMFEILNNGMKRPDEKNAIIHHL